MPVANMRPPHAPAVVRVAVVEAQSGGPIAAFDLQATVLSQRGAGAPEGRVVVRAAAGYVDSAACAAFGRLAEECDATVEVPSLPGALLLALQLGVDGLAHEVLSQVLLRVREVLADWVVYEAVAHVATAHPSHASLDLPARFATAVLGAMLEAACTHDSPPAIDKLVLIRGFIHKLPASAFLDMHAQVATLKDDDIFAETHKNAGFLFAGVVGCVWCSTADWITRMPSLQQLYRRVVVSQVYTDFKRHLLRYAAKYNDTLMACGALGNELLCAQSVLHRLERCVERGDDVATLTSQASFSLASSYPLSCATMTQISQFSVP